jgi:O-antigen ligase
MQRLVWLSVLAFGAGATLYRAGSALKLLRALNPFLLLFAALATVSVLWSIDPSVTMRRVLRVFTFLLAAMALALLDNRPRSFQSVLRPILTLMLVGSIIFTLMYPELGTEQTDNVALLGAWRGLTFQKNALGSMAAITLLLWWHAWLAEEKPAWQAALGMIVSLTCILKSHSATSLMESAFALPFVFALLRSPRALQRYMPYLTVAFVCLLLTYSLAVLKLIPGSGILLSPLTTLMGKDLTFSNRTSIWAIIDERIAQHPLLGGGYGAYWVDEPGSPSQEMRLRLFFYPTEGHNAYLDVINDLGVAGALCLFAYLLVYLRQSLRVLAVDRSQGALYLGLLFGQLIGNLFESHWFSTLTCEFFVMMIATVIMARQSLDVRTRMPSRAARVPAGMRPLRRFQRR